MFGFLQHLSGGDVYHGINPQIQCSRAHISEYNKTVSIENYNYVHVIMKIRIRFDNWSQ